MKSEEKYPLIIVKYPPYLLRGTDCLHKYRCSHHHVILLLLHGLILPLYRIFMSLVTRKPVFGVFRPGKAQTGLPS